MGRGPSSIGCFMLLNIWGLIHGLAPPAANSEIPALALPGSPVRWGDSYPLEQGLENTRKSTINGNSSAQCQPGRAPPDPSAPLPCRDPPP